MQPGSLDSIIFVLKYKITWLTGNQQKNKVWFNMNRLRILVLPFPGILSIWKILYRSIRKHWGNRAWLQLIVFHIYNFWVHLLWLRLPFITSYYTKLGNNNNFIAFEMFIFKYSTQRISFLCLYISPLLIDIYIL